MTPTPGSRALALGAAKVVPERRQDADDHILAAIKRLTRTDEWEGGRGWSRRRERKESRTNREARGGKSTRPWQESLQTFLHLNFREVEDVAQVLQRAERDGE